MKFSALNVTHTAHASSQGLEMDRQGREEERPYEPEGWMTTARQYFLDITDVK